MMRPARFPYPMRYLALLVLLPLALNACSVKRPVSAPAPAATERSTLHTPPPETPRPLPRPLVKEQLGPAASLYAQADAALTSGQPERAEILLERALRIEPGNALYWHALGRAKYDQGDYAQAVQFCLKAQSRMGRRSDLARYNQELLDNASRQLAKSEQEKRKTQ